ncbi:MAG: ECF-type sigma factor, partial [Pseudomonadota bacterium]
ARRRKSLRRGGDQVPGTLNDDAVSGPAPDDNIDELDEALTRLEAQDEVMAQVVKLRYFAGLTNAETASALDLSPRTATRHWTAARAWLARELKDAPAR